MYIIGQIVSGFGYGVLSLITYGVVHVQVYRKESLSLVFLTARQDSRFIMSVTESKLLLAKFSATY